MLACGCVVGSVGVIAIAIDFVGAVDDILSSELVVVTATDYHYFALAFADFSFFFFAFDHFLDKGGFGNSAGEIFDVGVHHVYELVLELL